MSKSQLLAILVVSASFAACGGNDTKQEDCMDASRYQNRVEGKRVVAPEGMDQLDELEEMPIPRADPDAAQPAPGACIETPPLVQSGS